MTSIAAGDGAELGPVAEKLGRRRAAGIYGAIITAAILDTAGGHASTTVLVISVVGTLLVYWIAEEYAEVLGGHTAGGRLPSRAWLAGRLLGHEPTLALGLAGLVGLLTVLGSADAQRTIRTWIQHRAETRIAAAEAYWIRRQIRAATCGPRRTTADAARIRDTAVTLDPDHPSLVEIMRITRHSVSSSSQ